MMRFLNIFYWVARLLAGLSILLLLFFFVGEQFAGYGPLQKEWLLFLFFPVGVVAGLILGMWKSAWGGRVSVLSIGLFYFLTHWFTGAGPQGLAFLAFSLPGFLFLLHGILAKAFLSKYPASSDLPHSH